MFCTNCGTELLDGANFCSNCGLQIKEGVQQEKTEVCRIVEGWDAKRPTNRWWEAKHVTPQGEETIHQMEYYDEMYRSDIGYVVRGVLSSLVPFSSDQAYQEELRKSEELKNGAHSRLFAQLIQEGWEPGGATDQSGRITMMKRTKP